MQINFPKHHKLDLTANSFLMVSTLTHSAYLPYLFNSSEGYVGSEIHNRSCLSKLQVVYCMHLLL